MHVRYSANKLKKDNIRKTLRYMCSFIPLFGWSNFINILSDTKLELLLFITLHVLVLIDASVAIKVLFNTAEYV